MIEFLFWEGCPSHERALADLIAVMDGHGLEREHLRITELHTQRDAEREQFIGSPTIRVDGVEVEAGASGESGDAGFALDCRIYYRADGKISPLPDPEKVREAVADYASRQPEQSST